FSLVHDDIEDRDVERRHRAALWTIYGIPQAINAGDLLSVLSRLAIYLYCEMVGKKTASLIAASVQAGAMLATEDEAIVQAFHAFGWALGIAFQLNDDLLGIWGAEQATGKEPSDLAKHKKTLPVIYALEHDTLADRRRL